MIGQLTVTVTIEYAGTTATAQASETNGNPVFAAMTAEKAVVDAGQRAVAMVAAVHGDSRRSDPSKRLNMADWPLGSRPDRGWRP